MTGISLSGCNRSDQLIFLEAESFKNTGGWVVDQQSFDIIGYYLLCPTAWVLPVPHAVTSVRSSGRRSSQCLGAYRTLGCPVGCKGAPGKFQLLFGNIPIKTIFGTEGAAWHWPERRYGQA